MSTSHLDGKRRGRGWPLPVLGAIILLLGLVLAVGGGYLAVLGGSWYYVLAGISLAFSGVQLVRGARRGQGGFARCSVGRWAGRTWGSGLSTWPGSTRLARAWGWGSSLALRRRPWRAGACGGRAGGWG